MGAELVLAQAMKDKEHVTLGDLLAAATDPVLSGHAVFDPKTWLGRTFPNGLDVKVPAWMLVLGGGAAVFGVVTLLSRLSGARTQAEVDEALVYTAESPGFSEAGVGTVGVGENAKTVPVDVLGNHSWLMFTLSTGEQFWLLKVPANVYEDFPGGVTTEWWVLTDGSQQARSGDINVRLQQQAVAEGKYPPVKLSADQKRYGHAGPPK